MRIFNSFGKLIFASLLLLSWQWGGAQSFRIDGVQHQLAGSNDLERLQVYVLMGRAESLALEGDATASVWRYSQDALQAEPVSRAVYSSELKAWLINQPESGYGYFVRQAEGLPRYCFLIDYAAAQLDITALSVDLHPSDPCSRTLLVGQGAIPSLAYYTPSGVPRTLARDLSLRYDQLVWDETSRSFRREQQRSIVEAQGDHIELESSLADTPYTLEGDKWTKAFGLDARPITSSVVETNRLAVYPRVEIEGYKADKDVDWENLSAPATLQLVAVGNEPSVAKYQWRIDRIEDNAPVLNYTGAEATYTFNQSGRYRIRLDVSNRSGTCFDNSFEQIVRITESSLEIPNTFSPGSSPGVNDVFKVLARSLIRFDARIFSPSGQELYHWTDPNGGWDGHYRGRIVPSGVYYYVIRAEGSDGVKYNRKGSISILKSEFDAPETRPQG
ncbi:MAG: gliding motility-associated C-terminal domain-containing protein [Porphyromonadaceae bacterium]|nr:gliding motility-associated C-terminal domain-containing protein [Porphyromonadaceae bacterium]